MNCTFVATNAKPRRGQWHKRNPIFDLEDEWICTNCRVPLWLPVGIRPPANRQCHRLYSSNPFARLWWKLPARWRHRTVLAVRYLRSTVKFLLHGAPTATPQEIEERFEKGCMLCPHYNVQLQGCMLCGCRCNLNPNWLFNKLARRTESCPAPVPLWSQISSWQGRLKKRLYQPQE